MKNSNDTIGNRTRNLPDCIVVPQPSSSSSSSSSSSYVLLLLQLIYLELFYDLLYLTIAMYAETCCTKYEITENFELWSTVIL